LQRSFWLVLLNRRYSYVFVKTLRIKLSRGDKKNQIIYLNNKFCLSDRKHFKIINYIANESVITTNTLRNQKTFEFRTAINKLNAE